VAIGREFAGVIEKMGPEPEAEGLLEVGDLVPAEGHITCGHCTLVALATGTSVLLPGSSAWTGTAPSLTTS